MKTSHGKLSISVIARCSRCGNDIEKTYHRTLPKPIEIWKCPVCSRMPDWDNKIEVRIKHSLVKQL